MKSPYLQNRAAAGPKLTERADRKSLCADLSNLYKAFKRAEEKQGKQENGFSLTCVSNYFY